MAGCYHRMSNRRSPIFRRSHSVYHATFKGISCIDTPPKRHFFIDAEPIFIFRKKSSSFNIFHSKTICKAVAFSIQTIIPIPKQHHFVEKNRWTMTRAASIAAIPPMSSRAQGMGGHDFPMDFSALGTKNRGST